MRERLLPWAKLALLIAMCAATFFFQQLLNELAERPTVSERLFDAAARGSEHDLDAAIYDGASVNARNKVGVSALDCAVQSGNPRAVRRLLLAGAKVNQPDYLGTTPLMWAALGDRVEIARLLIASGANIHARDHHNKSARDLAIQWENTEVAEVLRDAESTQPALFEPEVHKENPCPIASFSQP